MRRRSFIFSAANGLMIPFVAAPIVRAASIVIQTPSRGSAVPAGACTTTRDANTANENSTNNLGSSTANMRVAFKFIAGASYTACAVDFYIRKSGSPIFNLRPEIWSHSSGTDLPDASLSTGDSLDSSTLGTTANIAVKLTGLSASIISGTTYWACVFNQGAADGSNFVLVGRNSGLTGAGGNQIAAYSTGSSTWLSSSTTRRPQFQIYS